MANECWIIAESSSGYRIERLDQAGVSDVIALQDPATDDSKGGGPEVAAQISQSLKQNGYRGERVMIALGTDSCFPATYVVDDAVVLKNRDFLSYEFERFLPFSAEEIVADFVFREKHVFGVGVCIDRHAQLIKALRFEDIQIAAICPHSMLAAQSLMEKVPFESGVNNFWMLIDGAGAFELVLIEDRQPHRWLRLPSSPESAAQTLELLHQQDNSNQDNCRIWAVGTVGDSTSSTPVAPVLPTTQQLVQRLSFPVQLKTADQSLKLSAETKSIARKILDGKAKPWFEFNRGVFSTGDRFANVRSAINYSLIAVSLGILMVMASLAWQTHQLNQARSKQRRAQEAAFAQLHPGAAIPKGIKMRLQIERKQLLEKQAFAKATQIQGSPLVSLQMLLSSIPAKMAIDMQRIKFQPDGSVDFDAQFANRADAEALKQRFVEAGFEVSTFPTRYQDDKVNVAGKLMVSPNPEEHLRGER